MIPRLVAEDRVDVGSHPLRRVVAVDQHEPEFFAPSRDLIQEGREDRARVPGRELPFPFPQVQG
jgi:hypothetical protein